MTPIPTLTRRALGIAALGAASLMLASCGGGSGGPASTVDTSPTSYGGGLPPGSVLLTVTHRVTITVSMPDTTGVDWNTIDLAGYNALPLVTKTLRIGLDQIHAPLSTNNFLAYLNSGTYANTIFHRVIQGFVVQGGGYTNTSGTAAHIAESAAIGLESRNGLSNTRGTLAMARTSEPNSATSEFYFNLGNNGAFGLDFVSTDSPGYAVFGTVLDAASMDTLAAIALLPTSGSGGNPADWPIRDITITAITLN